MGPVDMSFKVQPAWTRPYMTGARGGATPGSWTTGRYRVACTHDGQIVARDSFAMAAKPDTNAPTLPSIRGRVTGLSFFEDGPGDYPALADRRYAKRFDLLTTRYIATQVDLEMPPAGRVVDLSIDCAYVFPSGREMGVIELDYRIQPEWTRPYNTGARGWSAPGNWSEGTYRVICTHEGRTVAQDSFEVVRPPRNPVALAALGGRVTALRFFEDGPGDYPALADRRYATEFDSASTRYVAVQLDIELPAPGRLVDVDVECMFVRPDGSEMGAVDMSFMLPGDRTQSYETNARGSATAGTWSAGTYRVTCTNAGAAIARQEFTIVRSSPPRSPR
jgi:hypothetical protein